MTSLFAHSERDAALVALAGAQGAVLLLTAPLAPLGSPLAALAWGLVFAGGVWWGSNTVSHNHLHNPLFTERRLNRAFALYLTLALGVPQTLWRHRHMQHHAGEAASARALPLRGHYLTELLLVGAAWVALLVAAPVFFLAVYLPGWALGLGLCSLQGRFEHTGAPDGVSCYGRGHNLLWLNDGYHAEHHRWPRRHWTRLPDERLAGAATSPLPPALRPLESLGPRLLCRLEGLALRSSWLQRALVSSHRRALGAVLGDLRPDRVLVVGGGLFPRTVLALSELVPGAHLEVLDASEHHIATARARLGHDAASFRLGRYEPGQAVDADLVILPLAYEGERDGLYQPGDAPRIVHDWVWRRRGCARSAVVSWLLAKRVNLVPAASPT